MGTRASLKARDETVPEVHGVNKELDLHKQPEQQYAGQGAIPKRGSLKGNSKNPVRKPPHRFPQNALLR